MKSKSWLGSILLALVLIIAPNLLSPGVSMANTNTNNADHWVGYFESLYPNLDVTCDKPWDQGYDPTFVIPEGEWSGADWIAVVVKAGKSGNGGVINENEIFDDITPGTTVSHPSGKEISHMIICWGNDNTPPPPTTVTFDPPVSMDPCNESGKVNPPVWTSKPVTNDQIVVTEDVNGTITVAPKEGFVFAAGTVTTFSLPTDDPADLCSVPEPDPKVVTPPEPTQVDPCNEPGTADNVTWTYVPPSAVGYTVVENGDTVTITAVKGYVFDDGKTVLTHTLNPDSGVPCYVPPTVVTFTPPAFIDPCNDPGVVNAPVWTSMPAGDAITYSVNGGTITVAPKPGFVFAEGTVTTFSLPLDDPSNLCYNPVLSIPITPDVKDVCNPVGVTYNAVWVVPVNTALVTWELRADGHLLARAATGYKFTTGLTVHDFGLAPDDGFTCAVTPY